MFSCFPLLNSFEEELDEYERTTTECSKRILRGRSYYTQRMIKKLKQQEEEEE